MQEDVRRGFIWKLYSKEQPPAWKRYGFALLATAVSLSLTYAVVEYAGARNFFSLPITAVVLATVYGGFGPGLFTAILTTLTLDYLYIEPTGMVFSSFYSVLRVIIYSAIAALISSIVASLRHALHVLQRDKREVERVSEARKNVVESVSHDLKNPLTAISLIVELLERQIDAGNYSQLNARPVQAIQRLLGQIRRIIEDLLEAGSMEAGVYRVEAKPINPGQSVLDAVESMRPVAEEKKVRLSAEIDADLPFVSGDRLERVFSNLIGNALQFAPEGGQVIVRAKQRHGRCIFEVEDNGPGINEDHLAHLFDRYWRAENSTYVGAGLGLYISKGIVESCGGRIWAENRPEGGAVFYFTLPVHEFVRRQAA